MKGNREVDGYLAMVCQESCGLAPRTFLALALNRNLNLYWAVGGN